MFLLPTTIPAEGLHRYPKRPQQIVSAVPATSPLELMKQSIGAAIREPYR